MAVAAIPVVPPAPGGGLVPLPPLRLIALAIDLGAKGGEGGDLASLSATFGSTPLEIAFST